MDTIQFFMTAARFRSWLEKNHTKSTELWVGYYKRDSGRKSITWPESVDQALCFGWIDGLRKSIDETSYKIRFTPRKRTSTWSKVNVDRASELIELGLMQASGLAAFEARLEKRSGIYSYEQSDLQLPEEYLSLIRANHAAWRYYQSAAPSYLKAVNWWVLSAKQETTRQKRLAILIEDSADGLRIKQMRK